MAFKLDIPTPCAQNWDEMQLQSNENERFCAHCQKFVMDFTQMSDSEIMLFFQNRNPNEKVCGRMTEKQLAEIYPEPQLKPSYPWLRMFATVFSSVLTLNAWGQNQQNVQQTPTEQLVFKAIEKENLDTNKFVLRGKVIHKTARNPLENLKVTLFLNHNAVLTTYTNSLGDFEFHSAAEKYPIENLALRVRTNLGELIFLPKDFEGKLLMVCEIGAKETAVERKKYYPETLYGKTRLDGRTRVGGIANIPLRAISGWGWSKLEVRQEKTHYPPNMNGNDDYVLHKIKNKNN